MAKKVENIVAIVLERVQLGKEFIEWPLHITIVPWFHGYNPKKLDELLESLASRHQPFSATVGKIEGFGPKKDVKVNVIDDCPELDNLHLDVFNKLEENGFIIHQKIFVGRGYRAHITRQLHAWLDEKKKIRIGSVSLVRQERMKKTGQIVKTIVKNYELG